MSSSSAIGTERDARRSSVKRHLDISALRSAMKERMIQQQRELRNKQRQKGLTASRNEEECFSLQCVGHAFGFDVSNPDVMDSLRSLEEEIMVELQYQAWYEQMHGAEAQVLQPHQHTHIPPPEEDWEEYYFSQGGPNA
jgi:hypothetical protein